MKLTLLGTGCPSIDYERCGSSNLISTKKTKSLSKDYFKWVPPFGDPWIKAYSQLPMAYRRVSRPSSPLIAKASTKRPFLA